ncbi:putative NADH oxidase [uncultured Desulfobacterium sp.]|uniref:Putative NADH oxidase n=1 Tax=uncultured Desulfobacterium sp. TaxID=201089 RepID=A0A445MVS4_9BACT|nr:putative NADH oxidase [uncultured Desulfobacterium sp.]
MEFQNLFSPININGMALRNRIVMTAMHLGYTPQGEVTDRLTEFYRLRAKGGVGLIIVGGCRFDDYGGMPSMIGINEDRCIPGLKRLTDTVKAHGAKIAAQLYHAGRYTHSSTIGGKAPFSASAIRSKLTGETPRALDTREIPRLLTLFAQAAVRAKESGFDAVEILGSAGYLISQFFSPLTNQRPDLYGGSCENRMRFGIEVVEKVRDAVGPDYPLVMRIAGNDFMEGGNTNKEAKTFAAALEEAGVDLFNVTGGWHETRIPQLTMSVPHRAFVYLAKGIKDAVKVPVLASNRINDPALAEEVLKNREADLVTMARALIADPELPEKARGKKTRLIYHCVACNQGCFDSIFKSEPATCLVNPWAGREWELESRSAPRPKKVLVIGGGPAGMKATCVAAGRGHKVTLIEKKEYLGGQLLLNRNIPGRQELVAAVSDLLNNLKELNVELILGKEADIHLVKDISPDAVVIATGATPILPSVPGIHGPNVLHAWDVLAGKGSAGDKVVIVGGNAVGLETALYLGRQGTLSPEVLHFLMINRAETIDTLFALLDRGDKKVSVVEMTMKLGQDIGASTRWTVLAELERLGVTMLKGYRAVEVTPEGLMTEKDGNVQLLKADTVVIAVGSRPENALVNQVESLVTEAYTIGDAKAPRHALDAIREGFEVGLMI